MSWDTGNGVARALADEHRQHDPPLCDVCGDPTNGEEKLLPAESGGRVAHQLCYWRQRALAGERKTS